MPQIATTGEFGGRHPETGGIHNVLAAQGFKASHTGEAYSEALLLGVSGGITFGYFTFEYKGYDPHMAILTRNTFDPMQTMLERLALPQETKHTSSADKGEANLVEALENGQAPLVWADIYGLPYNLLDFDAGNWAMIPVLVCGYDGDTAHVVDRGRKPFTVTEGQLATARGRVKKDKYRVMTLDAPDERKLASAVQKGIWDCISLFTDAPPRGAKHNFGFAGYEHFARMLTNTRNKGSWAKFFAPGRRMVAALAGYGGHPGLFQWIATYGSADGAERGLYADFLDEAAMILDKPALKEAGDQFRETANAWNDFAAASLPDDVTGLGEIRQLQAESHRLLIDAGDDGVEQRRQIKEKVEALREQVRNDFPLLGDDVATFREGLAEHVTKIHALERDAIAALQDAMG